MALFSARKATLFVGPQGAQGDQGPPGPPGPVGPTGPNAGIGAYSSRPGSSAPGKLYYPTDGHTPFVDDGSAWRPLVQGIVGSQPPLASAFTGFNLGGASLVDNNGALDLGGLNDGSSFFTMRGFIRSLSSSTAFVECAMRPVLAPVSASNTYTAFGIIMRESATAKSVANLYVVNHSNGAMFPETDVYTNDTTRASNAPYPIGLEGNGPLFLRLRRNGGSSLIAEWSRNRVIWTATAIEVVSSVFTTAPDQVGIVVAGANTVPRAIVLHYLDGSL